MNHHLKTAARVLFALYIIAILFLCFGTFKQTPDLPVSIFGIPLDKCVHFLMFLPFVGLATASFMGRKPWKALCFCIIFGLLTATAIETFQGTVNETRTTDILDLVANLLGLTAGALITAIFVNRNE